MILSRLCRSFAFSQFTAMGDEPSLSPLEFSNSPPMTRVLFCTVWGLFLLIVITSPRLWASEPDVIAVAHIQDVTTVETFAEGRMTLQLCNVSSVDLKNVNVRAPGGGGNRLNQGVVQFGSVAAGQCKSRNASFVWQQLMLDEATILRLKVDYDIGSTHIEQLVDADRIDLSDLPGEPS